MYYRFTHAHSNFIPSVVLATSIVKKNLKLQTNDKVFIMEFRSNNDNYIKLIYIK